MTEAQLSHLSAVMHRLEEALVDIENGIEPGRREEIMAVYRNDLPSSQKPAICREIEHLRHELRSVKERYTLTAELISDRRRFVARLALLSVELEEATSRYMAGYGTLPEVERNPLDSQINRMIGMVDSLRAIIAASG
jgi:hypothetical protein